MHRKNIMDSTIMEEVLGRIHTENQLANIIKTRVTQYFVRQMEERRLESNYDEPT